MQQLSKLHQDILDRVNFDYQFAKAERDKSLGDWTKWRAQYDAEWYEFKVPDGESLDQWFYVPTTRRTIHRKQATLQTHFFPQEGGRLGKVMAASESPAVQLGCHLLNEVLNKKLDIECNPWEGMYSAFEASLVEASGVLKLNIKSRQGPGGGTETTLEVQHVPNESCCWDPYALSQGQITFFIHERWLSEEQLLRRAQEGVYSNVEDVINGVDEGNTDEWRKQVGGPNNGTRKLFKVIEYWGSVQTATTEDLDQARRVGRYIPAEDVVITCHANRVLMRIQKNPFAAIVTNPDPFEKLPFVICTPLPKRNSTRGHSMAGWMRNGQREINATRNQRRRAVQQALVRKIFFDQSRLLDLQALQRAKYGGAVPVDGNPGNVIFELQPMSLDYNFIGDEQSIQNDLDELTGTNNFDFGRHEQGVETATTSTLIASEGNAKDDAIVAAVKLSCVLPALRFFAAGLVRFMGAEEVKKVLGLKIPPPRLAEMVGSDYNMDVAAGATVGSRSIQLQRVNNSLMAVGQIANAAPQVAIPAMMLLIGRMLHLNGENDVAGYFSLANQQLTQQLYAQQGSAAQGVGGGNVQMGASQAQMASQGRGPTPAEQGTPPPMRPDMQIA